MIRSISIRNAFGIRELDVDFKIKSIREASGKSQEDQVIKYKKEYFCLIPTFLAKNATGKTSLMKSIELALKLVNFKGVSEELAGMAIEEYMQNMRAQHTSDEPQKENLKFDPKSMVSKYFETVSFAGSDFLQITLVLFDKKTIEVNISRDSFYVKCGDSTIDMLDILSSTSFDEKKIRFPGSFRQYMVSAYADNISKLKINFLAEDYSLIGRADTLTTRYSRSVNFIINSLIEQLGFETVKLIFSKIDRNIKTFNYKVDTKAIEIYVKDSYNDVPISPFDLSSGTQKMLLILNSALSIFKTGGILMIDEIENGLHLSLIKLIISLFTDPEINNKCAQLLLTTHNPMIIEQGIIENSNVYIQYGKGFNSLRNVKFDGEFEEAKSKSVKKRWEDQFKMMKSKNYYNDIFWTSHGLDTKSTLSTLSISQIVNSIAGSKNGK